MEPASDTEYTAMAGKEKAPPQLMKQVSQKVLGEWLSPKWVDAILAGSCLALASLFLHLIDVVMGDKKLPVFNGGMLTTAIIFFGGPTPPPPKGFAICTFGSFALGMVMRYLLFENISATCIGAGALLVYFKMAGLMFPPALGVAVALVTDPAIAVGTPLTALKWLFTPWLAGSGFLYVCSMGAASLRKSVRTTLSKAKFSASFAAASDEKIREVFNRYDTSGDGFLQAGELKFAWQVVTGEEMSEAEAQAMVESVDTDGNNEIDPDEFIALVREKC